MSVLPLPLEEQQKLQTWRKYPFRFNRAVRTVLTLLALSTVKSLTREKVPNSSYKKLQQRSNLK